VHHHNSLQTHWLGQERDDKKFLWTAEQPIQRPLSSKHGLTRFLSIGKVMDNRGKLQHDSHTGGEARGKEATREG
jgi:hypothetical protein